MTGINIAVAANDAYIPHVAAMLHSLRHHNPDQSFSVYFLHRESVDSGLLTRLATTCEQARLDFRSISVNSDLLGDIPVVGYYVEEAWYRVFMSRLLPDVDKVLWLDADAIVRADISDLWAIDLTEKTLAACPNAMLYSARELPGKLGITDRSRYFNTGVLLMNLKRMRENGAEEAMRDIIAQKYSLIQYADQDVLNCMYSDDYVRLELKWNMLTHSLINVPETRRVHGREEFKEAKRNPCIVHFTGPENKKPWSYRCGNPHREAYLYHRKAAGWGEPDYKDRSIRTHLARMVPLRWRSVFNTLIRRRFRVAMSYMFEW